MRNVTRPKTGDKRLDLGLLPPGGTTTDRLVFVAFGPWRRRGSRSSLVGGLCPLFWGFHSSFLGSRFVGVAPRAIRSSRLQPHLGGNVEWLVGVVWCGIREFRLAVGIFGSSRGFIGSSAFFFVSGTDMAFLTRSTTSRPQPTMSGRLGEER
jgi:hypothetical protein